MQLSLPFAWWRKSLNLSLRAMAEQLTAAGHVVSYTHLGLIETGKRLPSPELLTAMTDLLVSRLPEQS